MLKWQFLGILILGAMIFTAGCTGFAGEDDSATPTMDTQLPTPSPTDTSGGETESDLGYIDGTTSDMTAMVMSAEVFDWDAEPGNDGLIIHFNFLDDQGRMIRFSNEVIKAEVLVYSADQDVTGKEISPRRVLFRGYSTITSYKEGGPDPESGIRVAFSRIVFTSKDPGIGKVVLKTTLPTGRVLQDDVVYLYAV